MEVSNYKCDICGCVSSGMEYRNPEDWFHISTATRNKESFWHSGKDICSKCAESSGIRAALGALEKMKS